MLEKFLKTGSRLDDPRVNIIIDFHFYNLTFCRENGFSPEKISTFCAIMKNLLDSDMKAVHRRWNTVSKS